MKCLRGRVVRNQPIECMAPTPDRRLGKCLRGGMVGGIFCFFPWWEELGEWGEGWGMGAFITVAHGQKEVVPYFLISVLDARDARDARSLHHRSPVVFFRGVQGCKPVEQRHCRRVALLCTRHPMDNGRSCIASLKLRVCCQAPQLEARLSVLRLNGALFPGSDGRLQRVPWLARELAPQQFSAGVPAAERAGSSRARGLTLDLFPCRMVLASSQSPPSPRSPAAKWRSL